MPGQPFGQGIDIERFTVVMSDQAQITEPDQRVKRGVTGSKSRFGPFQLIFIDQTIGKQPLQQRPPFESAGVAAF